MLQRVYVPASMLFAALLASALPGPVQAQGKKSDTVVKVAATATKPDASGKQVVTVTLKIDKGWHIYANPVSNETFEPIQTTVTVTGKAKPREVKVDYPPGKLVKDKLVGDHKIYEDKVEIKATVIRAKGDTGPLEVAVKFQACSDKTCLLVATVKVAVK